MSALRKIHLETTEPRREPVMLTLVATTAKTESHAKKMALFAAAPLIGLAYAVLLPFVGLGMLVKIAFEALAARYGKTNGWKAARTVAALAIGPFIGLAWIVALPFVGLCTLAWVGVKIATK